MKFRVAFEGHDFSYRAAPKSMAHDVEVVIARSMPGHQTLSTPAGLHAVVSLVTALAMHTGQPMQANTTSVAAFMVFTYCHSTATSVRCLTQHRDLPWPK
jgi:hypothetical protein